MLRLRTRLLLAYLAALIPLALGFGWWGFAVAQAGLEDELGHGLTMAANIVAADFSASSAAGRISRLEPDSDETRARLIADLEVVRHGANLRRVRVIDSALQTLLDTEPFEPFVSAFDLAGDQREIDGVLGDRQGRATVLFYGADGTPYKRGYAALTFEGEAIALVVVEGSATYFDLLHRFRVQVAVFGLALLLLIVVVTVVVSRRITQPLVALSDVARRIGDGDFDAPIPEADADEIGALAGALRRMKAGLAAREEESQMMLAGIAHEIRNPLGGMELFVGLLEESLADDSEEAMHAAKVRRELNYLSRVVEEFLLFARDRQLEWTRGPAATFIADVAAGACAIGALGVELQCDTEPPDLEISGDLPALRGVLLNLIQNAAQASPRGGIVTLVAREDNRMTVFTITDSGEGIPNDILENVFRPFFTTREKGTGLGLPLSRRIIERHGGTLTIESAIGRGTEITIRIPFRSDASRTHAAPASIGRDSSDWDGEMIG